MNEQTLDYKMQGFAMMRTLKRFALAYASHIINNTSTCHLEHIP